MLKQLLYTGISAAMIAKEKIKDEIEKLENEGKINKKDIENMCEKIEAKVKKEELKSKEKFKENLKEFMQELNIATKEDLEILKNELNKKDLK